MALHIDATADDNTLQAISSTTPSIGPICPGWTSAPYFIFDDEKQDWIAGPYRWLWLARLVRWLRS